MSTMTMETTDNTTTNIESELQAWREVHEHLSKAVLVAKEAVAVAKAQRRYWLEEICANLTPEGKLINTSTWKKTGKAARKAPAKRKQADSSLASAKRQKSDESEGQNWQNSLRLNLRPTETPILPNDAVMNIAQLYVGDQSNRNVRDDQGPSMPLMQAAQNSGTAGFTPAVRFIVCFLLYSSAVWAHSTSF